MQFVGVLVSISISVAVYKMYRPYAVAHPLVPESGACVLSGSVAFMDLTDVSFKLFFISCTIKFTLSLSDLSLYQLNSSFNFETTFEKPKYYFVFFL